MLDILSALLCFMTDEGRGMLFMTVVGLVGQYGLLVGMRGVALVAGLVLFLPSTNTHVVQLAALYCSLL